MTKEQEFLTHVAAADSGCHEWTGATTRAALLTVVAQMKEIGRLNLRCLNTGHPCGTDTVTLGHTCGCQTCDVSDIVRAALAAFDAAGAEP